MRAFKQFLSLVLVTCMLTSMFTIVSAAGPTMDGQVWDSDSGYVLIKQGTEGTGVDSAYNRVKDSGTVEVNLSENMEKISIDLGSKDDVAVTITGANLSGDYVLKVYDSGRPANMMYESYPVSAKENKIVHDDVDKTDTMKIEFSVPAAIMAGGSMLQVYKEGIETPAWIILYQTNTQQIDSSRQPVAVPPVIEEDKSVTIPMSAVETVLNNSTGGTYKKAYVTVSLLDLENASKADVYLDKNILNNSKFKEGYTLGIIVSGLDDDISYTWTFKAQEVAQQANAIAEKSNGQINLRATYQESTFGDSIPGTLIEIKDPSGIPDNMMAHLTVSTQVDQYANVFYKDDQGQWVLSEKNLEVDKGENTGGEQYQHMTNRIFPFATMYAIVASGVTAEQMNKEGGSDQEKPPVEETHDYKVTIDQANATVEVGKTTTLTATVTDKGDKITEGYTIQWKVTPGTGSATVDAKGVVTGGTKGTVTVEATATIGKDIVTSAPITVNVTSKGSTTPPTTGGGGSSSGGGGSWNDGSHGSSMPSAGSGTTTTPGTGTTTPGTGTSGNAQPQGCVSDTVGNFSVKGSYQYKLTSTNGQAPAVTVSNSNFRVVLASQNGKDYFFKVYAIGAVGQTCDVLVNGTKVSTVTASEVYGGVACDTTAPFTVKKGGSYQFKLTASSKPVMAAGSSSFRVEYVGNSGNDWFFKVYAVGNAGDGCGFYVNGAPFTVAVAHIGE